MRCTIERQITVALEGQPGRLAAICRVLAARGVNICALSVIDNVEHGLVRLITSDPADCRGALAEVGFYFVEADVLALDLFDRPGQLAGACDALTAARINVDYIYSSARCNDRSEECQFIFKVSDLVGARQVLATLPEA